MTRKQKNIFPLRNILEINISSIPLKEISSVINDLINTGDKNIFYYVNAHCLNLASKNLDYKNALNSATLVYSGGLGPVLASRILNQPIIERVPTPDFIENVFAEAEKRKWRIFLLGSSNKSLQKVQIVLKDKFPKIIICGIQNGFYKKSEEMSIVENINKKKPKILIVGMGPPKQELLIQKYKNKIKASTLWGVGALFDVISGTMPRAPFWMQKMGIEWLYRLLQEPRRLWKRYIFGNIEFFYLIYKDLSHKRN